MMARVVLCGSLLFSGIFSALMWQHWGTQLQEYAKQQQALRLVNNNIQTAQQQAQILKNVAEPFAQLKQQGMIGAEDRLNWIEVLQTSMRTHTIADVKYQIDPRQPVTDTTLAITDPRLQLHTTPVSLDMQLLHIGDLIYVLSDLQRNSNGNFRIESCEVDRMDASHLLSAKCQLSSFTLLLDAPQDVAAADGEAV